MTHEFKKVKGDFFDVWYHGDFKVLICILKPLMILPNLSTMDDVPCYLS